MQQHRVATGLLIGRTALTNFEFDPAFPYAGCRLCGEVYQSPINRTGSSDGLKLWQEIHNKRHTEAQHVALAKSGRWATPEASARLATFGIINIDDMLGDIEVAQAMREAPRAPNNDAEGSG